MNDAVTFFVGCVTFVVIMLLKIPVKKFTWKLAERHSWCDEDCYVRYKRYNSVLFFLIALVAVAIYYILYRVVELDHFKLCCTLKAGAMAIALYAVYEQWVGSSGSQNKN